MKTNAPFEFPDIVSLVSCYELVGKENEWIANTLIFEGVSLDLVERISMTIKSLNKFKSIYESEKLSPQSGKRFT